MKSLNQDDFFVTLTNQLWKGAAAIFVIKEITLRIARVFILRRGIFFNVVARIRTAEAIDWIIK